MSATVVGTFHSGFRATDETTGYVLLKTAQILESKPASSTRSACVPEIRWKPG